MVRNGNNIKVHYAEKDTLLNIAKKDVLKKSKGVFYLNRVYNFAWRVIQLTKENTLTLAGVTDSTDVNKLKDQISKIQTQALPLQLKHLKNLNVKEAFLSKINILYRKVAKPN